MSRERSIATGNLPRNERFDLRLDEPDGSRVFTQGDGLGPLQVEALTVLVLAVPRRGAAGSSALQQFGLADEAQRFVVGTFKTSRRPDRQLFVIVFEDFHVASLKEDARARTRRNLSSRQPVRLVRGSERFRPIRAECVQRSDRLEFV
jgi:hypothetical protein